MQSCFYLRFSGELWLKNESSRQKQVKLIIKNLKLPKEWIINKRDRLIILNKNQDLIFDRVSKTFGISSFSIGFVSKDRSIDAIKTIVKNILEDWGNVQTFKVDTTRSDKGYPMTSIEINKELGEFVLNVRPDLKVDLKNPEKTIIIELRRDHVFVSDNVYEGLRGLPYGFSGKAMALLSGGIDSPVATFLAMKRGIEVTPIHFYIDDESLESVKKYIEILGDYGKLRPLELFNHKIWLEKTKERLLELGKERYLCIFCKRRMLKLCEKLGKELGIKTLVTGDSVSQVASQTLENLYCICHGIDLTILRPLACQDKEDIVSLAKKIGTFEHQSTKKCPFVPKNPIIKADLRTMLRIEKDLKDLFEK